MPGLPVIAHDGQRVGRPYVPARREIGCRLVRRDPEDEVDLAHIGGEGGAATHCASMVGPRWGTKRSNRARCRLAHSITASARSSMLGGTVKSSDLAVLRLVSNKNFVGCSIGRPAGLAPFRILST